MRVSAVARTCRARRPPAAATGDGPVERARERLEQQVVVVAVAHVDADPVVETRGRRARRGAARRRSPAGSSQRHEEEVRPRRQRLQTERAQRSGKPLALLDDGRDVRRLRERRERERGRERRDRQRRLPPVQLGGRVGVGERVADACAGEPERLRERAEDDHAVVEQVGGGLARVLEVRLVDDERARLGQLAELTGRVVRAAAERHAGIVVADLRARQPDRDAVERVGRARRRSRPSRPARRTRARRGGSGRPRRRRARCSPARRPRSAAIASTSSG